MAAPQEAALASLKVAVLSHRTQLTGVLGRWGLRPEDPVAPDQLRRALAACSIATSAASVAMLYEGCATAHRTHVHASATTAREETHDARAQAALSRVSTVVSRRRVALATPLSK